MSNRYHDETETERKHRFHCNDTMTRLMGLNLMTDHCVKAIDDIYRVCPEFLVVMDRFIKLYPLTTIKFQDVKKEVADEVAATSWLIIQLINDRYATADFSKCKGFVYSDKDCKHLYSSLDELRKSNPHVGSHSITMFPIFS